MIHQSMFRQLICCNQKNYVGLVPAYYAAVRVDFATLNLTLTFTVAVTFELLS